MARKILSPQQDFEKRVNLNEKSSKNWGNFHRPSDG